MANQIEPPKFISPLRRRPCSNAGNVVPNASVAAVHVVVHSHHSLNLFVKVRVLSKRANLEPEPPHGNDENWVQTDEESRRRRGERGRGEKEDETESTSGEAAVRGEKKEWRKKGQEDGKEEKEPLQHDPGHSGAPFQPDRKRRQT